jgi:bifunctional DNA-binding transcriptional regulator/antitoxin component of YhaV-PrlF toxin-antitoxin module
MQILASENGELLIPGSLCGVLGIRPGESVDATVEDGRIVLKHQSKVRYEARIVIDPTRGLPALTAGPDAPKLTSEAVAAMLVDFP